MTVDDNRLRVTVELGATMPFGEMGFIKPLLRISNIDPDGDVKAQVQRGIGVAAEAFAEIDGELERVISDMLSPMLGKPGYSDRVEKLEQSVGVLRRNVRTIVAKIKEQEAPIAEVVAGGTEETGA